MSKLLDALRERFPSPQAACEALGIDPASLPAHARYELAQDGSAVTDKHTGHTYTSPEFAKALFDTRSDPMLTTLQRRLARDADLPSVSGIKGDPKTMVKDQDDPAATGSAPSAEECLQFVQMCMQGLQGDELQAFLSGLSALISHGAGAPAGDDAPNNNLQVMDRKRAARDRRPAQDSNVRALNHKSFLSRHSYLNVDVWR